MQLLDYVTVMPTTTDSEKRCYKIPFISAEILKVECSKIEDIIVSECIPIGFYSMPNMNPNQKIMTEDDIDVVDGRRKVNEFTITKEVTAPGMNTISNIHFPFLHKLFSVLLSTDINEVLSGYLNGIVFSLSERKGSNIISFLMENTVYFDKMIENIQNKSISDLLLKLLSEEIEVLPAYEERFRQKRLQIVLGFLRRMEPTNHMLDILNACFIAVQAITSLEYIGNELATTEIVSNLYDTSLKGNQYSLRASILIIMSLLKKMSAADLSAIIVAKFDELIKQLSESNFGLHPSSVGSDVLYAGVDKYRIIEFISMLVQLGNDKILDKMKQCSIVNVLLNLFTPFYNCSILTSKIKQLIIDIVMSNNASLISSLLIQPNIANTIIQLCKQLMLSFPTKRVSPKPTKIILYRIVETFNKSTSQAIKDYLKTIAEWSDIETKYFADIAKIIRMNMRDDEITPDLNMHNNELMKERENQVIKAFTEYNTNDQKYTITEYCV